MRHTILRIIIPLLLICFVSVGHAQPLPQVALVLGGGAARGFSHVGLIQAFEDHGIPIDMLVGTSMGSIIASLYAAGYSVENMREIVAELNLADLVDIPFPPRGGLVNTDRIRVFLDALLDHSEFSDLDIPFYSVITNVTTGEELALHDGSVSTGVLASMSIPALFPTVPIGGQYYVDGGMKNAVPVNVAKDFGADVVVGVDVKKELETINYDNILNMLQLTMWFMIDGYVQLNTEEADVIIVPDVMFDSYMDYQKSDYFIDQGYLSGLKYIEEIQAAILAHDPEFTFVPYKQAGFSSHELEARLERAQQAANEVAMPFTLNPDLQFTKESAIPTMGLAVTGGPLGWWRIGYRYNFSTADGGHEGYFAWSKPGAVGVEVLARKSKHYEDPIYGLKVSSPYLGRTSFLGEYFTNGTLKWRLAAQSPYLVNIPHVVIGSSLEVGARRLPEDIMYASVTPQVRWLPFEEYTSFAEVALVRPYLFAGLDLESDIQSWDPTLLYSLGVGSEVRLFGLYPLDVQTGVEFGDDRPLKWQLRIVGGRF